MAGKVIPYSRLPRAQGTPIISGQGAFMRFISMGGAHPCCLLLKVLHQPPTGG